jgi:uncharacterized phage-like protein YoqJ
MKMCCFSGYSTFDLSYEKTDYRELKKIMKLVIQNLFYQGYSNYLCNFDKGADLYFAESLFEMKLIYPTLSLESIIPYENQASGWPERERERYYDLLAKCDKEILLYTQYQRGCLLESNKIMIDNSDILITVFDGKLSLTMQAIQYAKKSSKKIICINPQNYNAQYTYSCDWSSTAKLCNKTIKNQ